MTTENNKAAKKCIVCKIDLNTMKSFQEREDWESVKFYPSRLSTLWQTGRRSAGLLPALPGQYGQLGSDDHGRFFQEPRGRHL